MACVCVCAFSKINEKFEMHGFGFADNEKRIEKKNASYDENNYNNNYYMGRIVGR